MTQVIHGVGMRVRHEARIGYIRTLQIGLSRQRAGFSYTSPACRTTAGWLHSGRRRGNALENFHRTGQIT